MIERIFTWFGESSIKRPLTVIIVISLITVFFAVGLFRIHQEYGHGIMLSDSSETVRTMKEAEEKFGGINEEQVLVEADNVLDGPILRYKVGDAIKGAKTNRACFSGELEKDPRNGGGAWRRKGETSFRRARKREEEYRHRAQCGKGVLSIFKVSARWGRGTEISLIGERPPDAAACPRRFMLSPFRRDKMSAFQR